MLLKFPSKLNATLLQSFFIKLNQKIFFHAWVCHVNSKEIIITTKILHTAAVNLARVKQFLNKLVVSK